MAGCNEIIKENDTGLLIEKKNTECLEQAIEKLLINKDLYNHIKSKVRIEMIKKYDQNYFWKELENEFKNINICCFRSCWY